MDMPSHLNAKHYAIFDALFHLLFSLSSLSLLSSSTSLSQSFPELPQTTITAELLGAMLNKFTYHHVSLEILIVKNLLILYARTHTHTQSLTYTHTIEKTFLAARCDSTKSCQDEARKEGQMNKIRIFYRQI